MQTKFIRHVVIIGLGVVEQRDENYYIKMAVANYLSELADLIENVTFVAFRSSSQGQFHTALDTSRVQLHLLSEKATALNIGVWRKVLASIDRQTAVFFQVPQTTLLPILPLLLLKAGRFVTYVAGDWIHIAYDLRKRGKGWRVPLDNLAARIPISRADYVLVRGPKLLRQVELLNKNVMLSLPISPIPLQLSEPPTDTALGYTVTLLYIGKLLIAKGVDVLLQAIAWLRQNQPQIGSRLRLILVGSGKDEALLRKRAIDLGLSDVTEFWGFVDEPSKIIEAYRQASIQVVPSIEAEGFPRVIEEGLLNGLPIIATAVGGIPDAFTHQREILIVPPNQPEAIADAIGEIILDNELRMSLKRNAYVYAQKLAAGPSVVEQHVRVLQGNLSENFA